MQHKTFYYARVSDDEKNLDAQLNAFHELGAQENEMFIDLESDRNTVRNSYQLLKNAALREGDTLIIKSLDRLSRNKADIKLELLWLKENGVRLKVVDMPTTMIELSEDQQWAVELINNLLIEAFNSTVVHEYAEHRQRQREGIDAAKAKGIRFGRPPLEKEEEFYRLKKRWLSKEISTREAAKILGVSHQTFWKWVR
ncbi:recombinase family protein [Agathobaculum sp. NTUH-O15-33]|uniref:recombinase family protein n=1 Tax=Agathobaculum sp. NTUH-O15-33 TaxID=3079302 RepID=UPI0029589BEF|nr:recombinase family protein [Agathobaculum sp. NTUH-O15-33]WNX83435.1 recombinase family protein [Agathobaculum sp. NTUH-O15-33]